ncbi:MAG: diacylglycerol kinase family protein, partial [Syntrophomonadaceae bacterium]|nr:diacylglycerol kinase family protein [Syntrophomonadaceae bacterium]
MRARTLPESFAHALRGIGYVLATQRNMRVHTLAALAALLLAARLQVARWEWAAIIFAIALVLASEAMNTAVEKTVDLATDEFHPLARAAKNCAAGAVLLAAAAALGIGWVVFGQRLL